LAFSNAGAQVSQDTASGEFLQTRIGIEGIDGGTIRKETILHATRLSFTDQSLDSVYTITSFRMTIINPGYSPTEFYNKHDGTITEEMKKAVQMVQPGTKMYIEYIQCKDDQNKVRKIWAASYEIE
jgi:hypothetical protein